VGSKGKKPRKPQHSQHLPKVGSTTETKRLMHEEHSAMADTMGIGNTGKGTRTVVYVIGAILLICAILALLVLITF
jgi:hypothetical protein